MFTKNLFLILTCVGCIISAYAQEPASSYPTKKELLNLIDTEQLPTEEKINNLRMLGQYYMGMPNDSAAFYFNKGIRLSKKEQDSFNAMRLYNRMALLQIYIEDDPAAIKYTDSAFSYANRNNQKHFASIAYSYQIQARANYYQELNDLALEKYLEANKYLLKDNQDPETKTFLAENYADLASLYLETDNKKTALVCINKSLNLSKPIEAWWEVGEAYEFLASYYFEEENYDRARIYLDSSKTMYRQIDYQEGVQTLDEYLSEIYLKEKKYDQAIATYIPLLKNNKTLEVPYVLVDDYLFISEVYTEKDEIRLATKYLDSAKIAALESTNLLHPINIGRQQAKIYKAQKNNKAAITEFTRLLNSEAINGYVETEKNITKDLYELHEKSNNTAASLMYYKRYNKLKDSLADALAENKFSVLKSEFNYNELNSKLESQEAQINFAKGEKKRLKERNFFITGFIGLLAAFFIFFFFRQRNLSKVKRESLLAKQEVLNVKQKALDDVVAFKNKQITDFAIHISEKNDLLDKIKVRLKGIKVTNDSHKEVVQDTIHFINSDMDQNREKIQLYQQVSETTDSFRAKIDQLYTNLNEKEKKVATMLRLGQTSKQIALQLGISSASVDNYRYNLRKKMAIPKGESLKAFIKEI
jgi:DNA-binding CsgD family transcriptional regulator/tetratricopeptide (TPR) repeat protein